MFQTIAFAQSIDPAGVYAQLNAVQDPSLRTEGKYAYVPSGLTNVVAAMAVVDGTVAPFAKFTSPSIRQLTDFQVRPLNIGLVPEAQVRLQNMQNNPLPVVVNEGLEFDVNSNPASAVEQYGILWLSDGAIKPTNGTVFTTHATASVTLAANTWVNGNLTFDETLPSGSYQVVGMRVESANGVAARLVFVGGSSRPGVPCSVSDIAQDFQIFRAGNFGVFGQFDSTTPPSIDILGVTDTSQDVWLDLIKVK